MSPFRTLFGYLAAWRPAFFSSGSRDRSERKTAIKSAPRKLNLGAIRRTGGKAEDLTAYLTLVRRPANDVGPRGDAAVIVMRRTA